MADTTPTTPTTPAYFAHNWRTKFEIDTKGGLDPTADVAAASFQDMHAFLTGVTPSSGDVIANDVYFSDEDNSNSEVTGHAKTLAITGNVLIGDPACDYIRKLEAEDATGNADKTLLRITEVDGSVRVQQVTVENIVLMGGNGNAKRTLSFTLAFNGKPVNTPAA